MSTVIYHNGQLQYSHKEYPKHYWNGDDFYDSLLPVVNPDAIIHDAFDEHICRGDRENPITVMEGDHWDVPDGVEVVMIKEYKAQDDKWTNIEYLPAYLALQVETRAAVRLSIKATI